MCVCMWVCVCVYANVYTCVQIFRAQYFSVKIICVITRTSPGLLEKEMATHSSVLAWRIPGRVEPGGLPSMGRTESDTTEAT